MLIELDKRFKNNVRGIFGKYTFEVGVLEDGPHYTAAIGKRGLRGQDVIKQYAGGPARKLARPQKQSGQTIAQVSKENRERLGFNYLTKPFEKKTSDVIKFTNEFFKFAFGHTEKKRAENLLQAVVRNPILRGEYKKESALTQKIKGFSRPMIDTSQLFQAIRARCTVRSV